MAGPGSYGRDPLGFLERTVAGADVVRLPGGELCVADPDLARDVLRNQGGRYREHSDFFLLRSGLLGPRTVQLDIGRGCRQLLEGHHAAARGRLPGLVAALVETDPVWPDAGNRLLLRYAGDALMAPGDPPELRRTVGRVVRHAVLAGARERRAAPTRALFRRRVQRELVAAVDRRRARPDRVPPDLLGVVIAAAPGAPAADLAEVFLGMVFALIGSVGFALGWSVHLLGTQPGTAAAAPALVVREALRLWPVAWLFERTAAREHELGPVPVRAGEPVLVCTYLAQRHPARWPDPDRFRPQRWAGAGPWPPYLAFGAGPHSCPCAGISVRLVEDVLRVLTARYDLAVDGGGRAQVGPALAPPRFRLRATRRSVPTATGRR